MTVSSARTLKGPRRFVRRVAHRANSPQWQFLRGFLKNPVMVGSVIPSSKVQLIQPTQAATVAELLVRSGQQVKRGQLLARLDSVRR